VKIEPLLHEANLIAKSLKKPFLFSYRVISEMPSDVTKDL